MQLVEHGVNGYLYPYNEPHTLAFLIADLYRDGETLGRISSQASAMAIKRHDREQIARTALATYEEIVEDYKKNS